MSKELNENTGFNISIKTLIGIVIIISSFISMWFMLKAEIAEARNLPLQEVTRIEYELKDELIRNTVIKTQEDIRQMQKSLDRIEDRVYGR